MHIVIIGAGLAGTTTAQTLREQGYDGDITLLAGEDRLPYDRPPLSKDYLAGSSGADDILLQERGWYDENRVALRLGTRATAVDPKAHQVTLEGGDTLTYDKLVLATGSTARTLGLPGADADGVHTLRTLADSDAIKAEFGEGRHVVVVGGGWIGLEVAATARGVGTAVTVLEHEGLPLLKVLGPEMAQVFADLHTQNGVELRPLVSVGEIVVEDGRATGVRLADGSTVEADAVVIGVGAAPDVELAQEAGLDVEDGVLVDASLRSSDPDVYAVGDIAAHDHPTYGRLRVEHWNAASTHPATAVAALLGGNDTYTDAPYFFSDQYDLGMEYVGHAPQGSYARVVTSGDVDGREFVASWLDSRDRLLAVMNVNVWEGLEDIRSHVGSSEPVSEETLQVVDQK
ncbi:FAD-dependent oxidoreductase [Actinomycetospora sp. NBRC 106378]|uniref:NAD(P)/FAD-dependent oxidoreductase n=1 Tax=Actinomycetospora sp. NBRC 106378 TaxID=3032208 RepID=UPI0024A38665|nr:FAD-dependent oxidoreductase [Actinomycetospora sp. NBRC 106378]GLZ51271.1 pyridine nucleotide-disulfide oxidoreductase [Actinomycetospora sp. NBRC 106378]